MCVNIVQCFHSTMLHRICLFVFGTTAPSGPGPPHSWGF